MCTGRPTVPSCGLSRCEMEEKSVHRGDLLRHCAESCRLRWRDFMCTGRPTAPVITRYRCFLPDLAGLAGLRRVGPGTEPFYHSNTPSLTTRSRVTRNLPMLSSPTNLTPMRTSPAARRLPPPNCRLRPGRPRPRRPLRPTRQPRQRRPAPSSPPSRTRSTTIPGPTNGGRVYIEIAPGTYHERVIITQNHTNITLIGKGKSPEDVVITNSLNAKTAGGTFFTETVEINGTGFEADNITFENSAGNTGQAVAVADRADRSIFKHCRFLGHQDTLFADYGRQYYVDSYIEGGVDFIFGNATAVFDHSELHANGPGYLTAQSRTVTQPDHRLRHPQQPSHQQHRSTTPHPWTPPLPAQPAPPPPTTPPASAAPGAPTPASSTSTPNSPPTSTPPAGTTGTIPPTKRPPTTPNQTPPAPAPTPPPASPGPTNSPRQQANQYLPATFPRRPRPLEPHRRSRQTPLIAVSICQ